MANAAYGTGINAVMRGELPLGGAEPLEALLVSDAYTFNGSHEDEADLTGVLARADISSPAVAAQTFDADDVTFAAVASGATAKAVVICLKTGVAATNILLAYYDQISNFPRATNDADIVIEWDASGILRFPLS